MSNETTPSNAEFPFFLEARRSYHAVLLEKVLFKNEKGVPSNADGSQASSVKIALGILNRLGSETVGARLGAQMSGGEFEGITANFLEKTLEKLGHLRPGPFHVLRITARGGSPLSKFEQFAHLADIQKAASANLQLAAALGNDYTITPDIVILRKPEDDEKINSRGMLVDNRVSRRSSLRAASHGKQLLHASISCKWTLRSDRAQNARSEALNLIRNRKGRLPHIVLVTGEPSPSRLSSIAIGTGDLDCVYHFALEELFESVNEFGSQTAKELMTIMVEGKRLRDIGDLPLDLAV